MVETAVVLLYHATSSCRQLDLAPVSELQISTALPVPTAVPKDLAAKLQSPEASSGVAFLRELLWLRMMEVPSVRCSSLKTECVVG